MARIDAPLPISLAAMHIPNQHTGRKPYFHQSVLNVARTWRSRPAVMIGDTNSGRIGLDETNSVFNAATDQWFCDLEALKWIDSFRHAKGNEREYTWFSPNKGNGFRLDQGFVNGILTPHLRNVRH